MHIFWALPSSPIVSRFIQHLNHNKKKKRKRHLSLYHPISTKVFYFFFFFLCLFVVECHPDPTGTHLIEPTVIPPTKPLFLFRDLNLFGFNKNFSLKKTCFRQAISKLGHVHVHVTTDNNNNKFSCRDKHKRPTRSSSSLLSSIKRHTYREGPF